MATEPTPNGSTSNAGTPPHHEQHTGRRIVAIVLGLLATIVVFVVVAVFVLTNTDWGHEQIRRRVVTILNNTTKGRFTVGRLDGNLLKGLTLHDVTITDSAGAPFLKLDSANTHYGIRSFISKKIELGGLTIWRPVVVLDRPPGGQWNWARIFLSDTTKSVKDTTKIGFGDWVVFHDVKVRDGDITVRIPWQPDSTLKGAARDSALRVTLDTTTTVPRQRVLQVAGGYQQMQLYHHLSGVFPLFQVAKPHDTVKRIQVDSLQVAAYPFRLPGADVRQARGLILINTDSLWFHDVAVALPDSRATLTGRYGLNSGDLAIAGSANPAALHDVRFLYPALPDTGSGSLGFRVALGSGGTMAFRFTDMNVTSNRLTLTGDAGFSFRPAIRIDTTNVVFTNLDTHLLQQFVPTLEVPRQGMLNGRLAADGEVANLALDADVAFDEPRTGRSRVVAAGVIGASDGVVRAQNLRVKLLPVQVALARIASPTLRVGGTITGGATVNGSTTTRLDIGSIDLTHLDRGERTHLVGRAAVAMGGAPTRPAPAPSRRNLERDGSSPAPRREREKPRVENRVGTRSPWFDVDITAQPLSLVTVGRFAPAIGLRGTARGPIKVRGTMENLAVNSALILNDGGRLTVVGQIGLGKVPTYDIKSDLALFNANTVVAKAPSTSITASAAVKGQGSDPATMVAQLSADVSTTRIDTVAIDSSRIRLRVGGGIVSVDTMAVRAPSTAVDVKGTFGLVAEHSGELSYLVNVDSLAGLARYIPRLTGKVEPRPAILAARVARARADSSLEAQRNALRIALGEQAVPKIPVDTPMTIAKDSLAGAVYAAGQMRGNIKDFDVRGRAGAVKLVALGNTVERARVAYSGAHVMTPAQTFAVAAVADSIAAAGFALDSVDVRATYREPGGNVQVAVYQNRGSDLGVRADYGIYPDRKELLLGRLNVRFDSTLWTATHASAVRWGANTTVIDSLELLNGMGGRLFVDGQLPSAGSADLRVQLQHFQAADALSLLQSDVQARALVGLDARLTGPLTAPVLHATATVDSASYMGTVLPNLRATADYADQRMKATADVQSLATTRTVMVQRRGRFGRRRTVARTDSVPSRTIATLSGSVPINLALQGFEGQRLDDSAKVVAEFRLDSLPLDISSRFTDAVANVSGYMRGTGSVRGTVKAPTFAGDLSVNKASFRVVAAGITMRDVNGALRLRGDTVVLDSVAGHTDRRIALSGGLGIKTPSNPTFDIRLDADNALVLDNEMGRIKADAQIAMYGPMNGVLISGGARVRGGVIYIPESDKKEVISQGDPSVFAVLDTTRLTDKELVPAESPLMANLRTDISLAVDRDTWVRSREANVEIYSDGDLRVRVDRAKQAIVLDGIVDTDRGQYTFLSKRFQVKSGSATFIGTQQLDPNIQVVAEYEVPQNRPPLTVRILIGGSVLKPRISLESDAQPPISQSDLLSYLAFGSNTGQLLSLGGGSSVSGSSQGGGLVGTTAALAQKQLASVVTGVLVDQLESKTGRALGADVFNITPVAGLPDELAGGNFGGGLSQFVRGTQVEFGKYFNRQLYVALQATPVFYEGKPPIPGFVVQYRFANLLGLMLESNWQPRYFLPLPSLSEQQVDPKNAFGLFLTRVWRF